MIILKLRCRTGEDFLTHYQEHAPAGAVFCPTTTPLDTGAPVVVEVICKALPNRVLIRGEVVSWRPALPRRRVRAGAVVRFDADEAPKRDFVLGTVRGALSAPPRRRHARLPVALPVSISVAGAAAVPADLREISVSGGLISGITPPPIGTDVVVEMVPPGSAAPMSISGRVLYHVAETGTGIRFLFREGGGSRRLRELVRRLKAS